MSTPRDHARLVELFVTAGVCELCSSGSPSVLMLSVLQSAGAEVVDKLPEDLAPVFEALDDDEVVSFFRVCAASALETVRVRFATSKTLS